MKNENDKFSNQSMKTTHQFRNVKKNEKMKNETQTFQKIVKIMSFFFSHLQTNFRNINHVIIFFDYACFFTISSILKIFKTKFF